MSSSLHWFSRILVAAIFLYHGVPKGIYWGFGYEKFVAMGLPGWLGPATGMVEIAGALALLAGVALPFASMLLFGVMIGAIATVQLPVALAQGMFTAGLERDLLIMSVCAYMALTSGARSASRRPVEI